MKKYFFLFGIILFLYFITHSNYEYASYNLINNTGYNNYELIFKNGINSNELKEKIYTYSSDYMIKEINNISVKCSNYDICIKEMFEQNNYIFEEKFLIDGFKINKIKIIADSSFNDFINKNDFIYKVY